MQIIKYYSLIYTHYTYFELGYTISSFENFVSVVQSLQSNELNKICPTFITDELTKEMWIVTELP